MYRPILLLSFPIIFWSGFAYGSALVWYNVLNGTTSLVRPLASARTRSTNNADDRLPRHTGHDGGAL